MHKFQEHPLISALNQKLTSCKKCKNHNTTGGSYISSIIEPIDCIFIAQNPGKTWFNKSVDINEIIPFGLQKENSYNRFFLEISELFTKRFNKDFHFYVTNVVKCSTEDNQVTDKEMLSNCSKYLNLEINYFLRENQELFIISLGKVSNEAMKHITINKQIFECYHPGYLNRGGTSRIKSAVSDLFDVIF